MFKPVELYVGLRYTRAKRRNRFISFISLTSMLGVTVGVAVLITVLSVMNGFEHEIKERILGMTAHVTIFERSGVLRDWQGVATAVERHPRILGAAPFVRVEAMLTHGAKVQGALIEGILPTEEPKVSIIDQRMQAGRLADLTPGASGIVLGHALATALQVHPGDKVTLVAPQPNTAELLPSFKQFTVTGIFDVDMHEYDSGVAFVHMNEAARLLGNAEGVTGLRLKTDDVFAAPAIGREVIRSLPGHYVVVDWTQYHVNFFRALGTQKTVMFVILALIVAVAAFNIVSTLMMVVSEKRADVAILRTLGLTPRGVMGIFVVQGTIIGLIGTLFGMVGGVLLATHVETIVPAIEKLFQTKFISADVYHIGYLPSTMRWSDVAAVSLVAFVLCLVATLYPSWRASRTPPADALRYE